MERRADAERATRRRSATEKMDDRSARLVAVTVFGFVLFGPPLLVVFDRPVTVFGLPLLWAYLCLAWALFIALVAVLVRRSG